MWSQLIRGTRWSELLDFVSPAVFDVMSGRDLRRQAKALWKSTKSPDRHRELCQRTDRTLARGRIPVHLEGVGRSENDPVPEETDRGQAVLRLFFRQLHGQSSLLLDLRHDRFRRGGDDGPWTWTPRSLFADFDREFVEPLRRLYEGFYRDDDARFRAALEDLGLDHVEDVFRSYFGDGDQRAVRFEMRHFQRSFHQVFVRSRDQGIRLHPQFLPLGIHLAFLYEHLSTLGGTQDVRGAFEAAWE